jgi:catechol 2,3-dioxygenase-like lactoylglutathione lyase family enzyme
MGGEAVTAIFDHIGIKVSDFGRSLVFYREALGTLGIGLLTEFTVGQDRVAGFGREQPSFWISNGLSTRGETHVAFTAASQAEVNAFYSVALSMGGRDNGAPGPRTHYRPGYYAAYVFDPDGYNVEAVHIDTEE